jgi:hypothetical protein
MKNTHVIVLDAFSNISGIIIRHELGPSTNILFKTTGFLDIIVTIYAYRTLCGTLFTPLKLTIFNFFDIIVILRYSVTMCKWRINEKIVQNYEILALISITCKIRLCCH